MYQKIIDILKESKTIAIFVHVNLDGDAVGSSLAVYTFLKKLGKEVHLFSPDKENPLPQKFQFLKNSEWYNAQKLDNYDCALALDCGDSSRLGDEYLKIFKKAKYRISIDHHESHEEFAQITLLEDKASSTAQIVYKVLKEFDSSLIDKDIAAHIYTGIITDSGSFSFPSTTKETHLIASELLSYGIDAGDISRKVMKDISINLFELRARVLSQARFYQDHKIAIISFRPEDFAATDTGEADTEGLINNILDVDTVEIAISIAQIKVKCFKVSFRTKQKVNAAMLASKFGGGGHANAAGCRIYGYYEDIYNKLLDCATEALKNA
ncbi:MAG TPA: hypothetical protein GXZ42_00750 [Clostridiales bacterium]|nr:hypothetical protein [Clostridiales bacterium]